MRPPIDKTMLDVAEVLSKRSTCIKAKVGCVLTDAKGRIIGSGYNGVARGQKHCNEKFTSLTQGPANLLGTYPHKCAGHDLPPGSETCQAVHAETNALIQCREPDAIDSVYCTAEPCFRCAKELLNTGARRVVFRRLYGPEPQAGALWQAAGREWRQEKG